MLAEWDRRFVTWRGHTLVRNDGLVWFLGELPVGVVLAAGLALAGRGVLVRQPAAASPAATAVGALVPLLGSSAARRRGRRAPLRALHLWGGCLGALVVLRVVHAVRRQRPARRAVRPAVRIGRLTYLRDTALSVGFGLLAGLPLAAVAVAAHYPEWIETLLSFLVVFSFFFLVGLTIRGILRVGFVQVTAGRRHRTSRSRPTWPEPAVDALRRRFCRCRRGPGPRALPGERRPRLAASPRDGSVAGRLSPGPTGVRVGRRHVDGALSRRIALQSAGC